MKFDDFFLANYNISSTKISDKGTGRKKTIEQVYSQWISTKPNCDEIMSQDKVEKDILETMEDLALSSGQRSGGVSFEDIRDLINYALEKKGIGMESNGSRYYDRYGDDVDLSTVENSVVVINYENDDAAALDPKENKRRTFSKERIKDTLNDMMNELYIEDKERVKNSIRFDESSQTICNFILTDLCTSYEFSEGASFASETIKHIMWQIKRYLYGHDVQTPYLLNIFSKNQGIGKSKLIEYISKHFESYTISSDLDKVLEKSSMNILTKHYVVKFDEIELPSDPTHPEYIKTQSAMKQLLTVKDLAGRAMYSEKIMKKRRVYTALATSNRSILKMMAGDTGLRRFIELSTDLEATTKDKIDAIVEKVIRAPWLEIWKGVDENLEKGYLHQKSQHWAQLSRMQAPKEHVDMFGDFIEYFNGEARKDFVKVEEFDENFEYETLEISAIKKAYDGFVVEYYGKDKLKFTGSVETLKMKLNSMSYKVNEVGSNYKRYAYIKAL